MTVLAGSCSSNPGNGTPATRQDVIHPLSTQLPPPPQSKPTADHNRRPFVVASNDQAQNPADGCCLIKVLISNLVTFAM
ncbi:hypothetical protein DdX_11620 [Ditylenchus destructor]|uniref:Uncharacterized protein n=1 Tax=Ditylenchus destructor TaxID=166010 RepID=A0AAD4N1X6_9BILA|nr:hypothetical protein DdX_11620 [Ditylenchus destructor]